MESMRKSEALCFIVEGLVGAGKSVILQKVANQLGASLKDFHLVYIPENETEFNTYKNFEPLSSLYANPKINAMAAQLHIAASVNKQIQTTVEHHQKTLATRNRPVVYLCERSLFAPLVFSDLLLKQGALNEFSCRFLKDCILKSANSLCSHLNLRIIGIYFLDTPMHVCHERIHQRGRSYELPDNEGKGGLSLEYLADMNSAYREHLRMWRNNHPDIPVNENSICDPKFLLERIMYAFQLYHTRVNSNSLLRSQTYGHQNIAGTYV